MAIALADEEVQRKLAKGKDSAHTKFLNYVLPAAWYISEIPMNPRASQQGNHFLSQPETGEKNHYKIIFTKAYLRTDREVGGKQLLLNIVKRTPLVEVWLDLSQRRIMAIKEPPAAIRYENVPMPIYQYARKFPQTSRRPAKLFYYNLMT